MHAGETLRSTLCIAGGEGGIRTHDPGFSQDTAFRERGLQPLGNLSSPLTQKVLITLLL